MNEMFAGLVLAWPLLVMSVFFTPREWLLDTGDDSSFGRNLNFILWMELRRGEWECGQATGKS